MSEEQNQLVHNMDMLMKQSFDAESIHRNRRFLRDREKKKTHTQLKIISCTRENRITISWFRQQALHGMCMSMIVTFSIRIVTWTTQIIIITNETFISTIGKVRFQTCITWHTWRRGRRVNLISFESILPICEDIGSDRRLGKMYLAFVRSFFTAILNYRIV